LPDLHEDGRRDLVNQVKYLRDWKLPLLSGRSKVRALSPRPDPDPADAYELMDPSRDEITLVAGDADYVPTIQRLRGRSFRFDVCFWDHAAREIKEAASHFVSLNPYLDHLRLR
jgi:hypothetical protein